MRKIGKSLLSLLLVLVMLLQLMPTQTVRAWADDAAETGKEEVQEAADAVPVGEDDSKREANIKQFRMSDGSMLAATYPMAIHFEESGSWIEVDNRLEAVEAEKLLAQEAAFPSDEEQEPLWDAGELLYHNRQNRFGVLLPVTLQEESWFGVSDSGHELYFRLAGTQASESLVEEEDAPGDDPLSKAIFVHYYSTVRYPEALPGAELRYEVSGQSLKEAITFPELGLVPEQLSYEIRAEGLRAEMTEDGEIRFLAEDETAFVFQAPFLMDAADKGEGKVAVELEELGEGCYLLRYTPEREWLESEERVWPVVLDPTITNDVDTNYILDSYVDQLTSYLNYGMDGYLLVGTQGDPNTRRRALIKYGQLPELESGDVIVNAVQRVMGNTNRNYAEPILVEAHAITSNWYSQSVKWMYQPGHEDEVLDFQYVGPEMLDSNHEKYWFWDVTSAVQRWYNGGASNKGSLANQGVMLISPSEDGTEQHEAIFYSADCHGTAKWPMLFINYRNTTGLESYWDYTSASAGRAGTASVNNFTGNLVLSRTDMGYSGSRMPANITFTYNQNDGNTNIGYGRGWRCCYSQYLELVRLAGVYYYKWIDGDGTRIYFTYDDEESKWTDENGLGYTLNVGSYSYTITDRDGNQLGFDRFGRLISMTDKLSNTLSIEYRDSESEDLRIARVTDGAGRVYEFGYAYTVCVSVTYMGTGTTPIERVNYRYWNYAMRGVDYPDGTSIDYTYLNNCLTEAVDIQRSDGSRNKLALSYEGSPASVTELASYDGETLVNSVNMLYGDHISTVTDNMGRWCAYEFNSLGNTVSVYNQKGQALYGTFASNDGSSGRANQMTHSSRLQDTVVNLLEQRAESGANWTRTVSVQGGETYSLSGVTAAGESLSMSAGTVSQSATSVSGTERTEVTIAVPDGLNSLTISGSGSADELQLEQAEAASRYNLLQNTDMDSAAHWTGTGLGAGDGISTDPDDSTAPKLQLDDSVLKLEGGYDTAKSYTQTLSVSGGLGDDYSFGAWVKSGSVSTPDSTLERHCGIRVRLLNGSTEVDSKLLEANTLCPEWQFLSGSLRASGAYDTVEFSFLYDYNANESYFDGAQLFREKFAYVYHYDDEGRVDKITDLEGRETTYTYRGNTSDITSITLPGGAEYSYSYTSSGLLDHAVSDTGVTSSYSYDSYGNPTGTTISGSGEKSLTSSMTYTADGNMSASVTGNDGQTVSYTNDTELSLVMSVTDPANTVTSNTYDSRRRPVSSQTGSSAITNTYSDELLTGLSHTNTANTSTDYTLAYGTAELLATVQVGSAYTLVENSYNPGTWTLARQMYGRADDDPDEDDRDGWAYEYSEFDDLTARWTVKDGSGTEFRYFYNSKGALARVEQYSTTVANGEVTSRTLLNTERYYYDATDRLIRVWETDAANHQHEFRWTYDSNDQVTELVETVNGQSFTYANSYNGDKQPTQSSYGSVLESFTYDGLGRLSQSAVSSGNNAVLTTDYSFLDLDATRTTTQVAEVRNRYGLTDESITYTYDSRGNITSVSFPWTVTVPDPEPTPTPTPPPTPTPTPPPGFPDFPIETMDPNDPGPIPPTPTPDAGLYSGTQANNSSGGVTTTITVTIYYEYDALNELVWEKSELEEKAWNYSYDLGGNILSKTEYSFENGVVGSTPLSTVTYTYGDADWPDLLTAYNGSPITHDDIGNPLSYRGWLFTWQGGRQLAAASDGTTSLSFVYNESGLRTEKTVGSDTHRYVYRGSTLVAEIADSYALYFHHDARGEIVGFTYVSGSTQAEYFYRKNLQGDVIGIVDASGASVAEYRYDAWGKVLSATGSMAEINPIRYRGYYFDQETGLYYVSSRYYDPEICRWINADGYASTGQGIVGCNMFAYCNNSSVASCDPSGMMMVNTVNVNDGGGNQYKRINSQSSYPYNNIPYGNSTIGYAGCEAIACYNTLISLGKAEPFNFVKDFFVNRFNSSPFSGWGMGGHWGAMPSDIEAFLESKEIDYIQLSRSELLALDYYGPAAGNYILCYWNGMPFLSSYHTIAVECTGYNYTAYNFSGEPTNLSIFNYIPKNTWHYINLYRAYYIPMQ